MLGIKQVTTHSRARARLFPAMHIVVGSDKEILIPIYSTGKKRISHNSSRHLASVHPIALALDGQPGLSDCRSTDIFGIRISKTTNKHLFFLQLSLCKHLHKHVDDFVTIKQLKTDSNTLHGGPCWKEKNFRYEMNTETLLKGDDSICQRSIVVALALQLVDEMEGW
ncbi:hypothetical protein BDD12DRAFT_440305 [Trichophaea hybrida]|nr:hypothetical protein BDD12DRAFT_440305 [Trichophaea hybrida]